MGVIDRYLRDVTRLSRWAVRTGWWLARSTPHPLGTLRLFASLWWAERRRGKHPLRLLRLDAVALWVGEFNDLHVIREAWGSQVHELPMEDPDVILDLGAHIGASVLWFHHRWPNAVIHAVEPDRRSLEKLTRNVGPLQQVTIHRVALADRDGRATFWEAEKGWSSSLYKQAGQPNVVTVTSLSTLLARVGVEHVDVLNVDVEGAEWPILANIRLVEVAGAVAGELHEGMGGGPDVEREAGQHGLAGFDVRFERREGSGHFTAARSTERRPPRTGRFARDTGDARTGEGAGVSTGAKR